MKFTLVLFAALAIIGLTEAHQFPDFGKGLLHEDIQDILDLIPGRRIKEIVLDYYKEDSEVRDAINYLINSSIIRDLVVDFEAIPEVINFFNYLHKEDINIYDIMNKVNKALDIEELVPPFSYGYTTIKKTGGIAGLFKDIKILFKYDDFIRIYVRKMKTSSAFVGFIDQLKSDNFQQIVNKVYEIQSFQIILNGLKSSGVDTQIVADIMFIVLGITVPNDVDNAAHTVEDELWDFYRLLPAETYLEIVFKYLNEDIQVQNAVQFILTTEFHDLLRAVESLKEYQAFVIYLQQAGLNIVDYIQLFHKAISMEAYVPKVETIFKSQFGVQKIGDGMKGMLADIYDVLPLDEINALYKEKLETSKIFANFIVRLKSSEMQKIINNLYSNKTYRKFVMKTREKGLEFQEIMELVARIFGFSVLKN